MVVHLELYIRFRVGVYTPYSARKNTVNSFVFS